MSADPPPSPGPDPSLPISSSLSPVEGLVREGTLDPPALPGQLAALDRFELLRLIGVGATGLVFLARDPASGGKVALKLLKPELAANDAAVKRFLREARHVQRLHHPAVVPVLEVSTRDERPYLVMPFFERGSLARRLQPGQPLERAEILPLARRIAAALQHAHERGIIHRDLKPGNVLLDTEGGACLADFGLARNLMGDSFIDPGQVHCEGTAPYMSPAAAAGKAEDTRADIYSFGALLYEMLTGQPPYEGPSAAAILESIRAAPPRPILAVHPKAAPGLVRIAEGAMHRTHRERYAGMADVIADLERVERGLAPLGPRGPMGAASWRQSAAKRLVAGAAILLLVVAGLVWARARMAPRLEVVRTIQLPDITHWQQAKLGDWNGDKEPDFYLVPDGKAMIVSSLGERLKTFAPEAPRTGGLRLDLAADVNGDGLDEAWLSWAEGTNLILAAYNQNLWPVKRFGMTGRVHHHPVYGTNYSGIVAQRFVDLDGDGRKEILAFVETGWGLKPRGFGRLDSSGGSFRWWHEIAPVAWGMETLDLNGDGKLDVMVGGNSTGNGNRLPDGTDDSRCYLYAADADGRLLWTSEVGTRYVRATPLVARASPSKSPQAYAWLAASPLNRELIGEPEVGAIIRLDSRGNVVNRFDAGAYLLSCVAADLDGDGMSEILSTDRLGRLHQLDLELKLRRTTVVTEPRSPGLHLVYLSIIAVTNLAGRSANQVVLSCAQQQIGPGRSTGGERLTVNVRLWHDLSVLILDADLRTLARRVLTERRTEGPDFAVNVVDVDHDGRPEIIWLDEQVRVLRLMGRGR